MLVLSTAGNCQETLSVFAPEGDIRIGETILATSPTLPVSVVDTNNDSGESRNNLSESARVPEGNGNIKQESSVGMNVGDRVVIAVDDKRLRQLQEKFGGCTSGMLRVRSINNYNESSFHSISCILPLFFVVVSIVIEN